MPKRLVVFVHGWGAGAADWWGSTKDSLRTHPRALDSKFHFHNYRTSKAPKLAVLKRFWRLATRAPAVETVGNLGLGQTLWTTLAFEANQVAATEVVLFGHSFGGIVIADMIRHAMKRADVDDEDRALLGRIRHIALCASPMDGASLADKYLRAATPFGTNEHVENLLKSNRERQDAVNVFVNFLQRQGSPKLTLFYAANDEVVVRAEAFEPFERAKIAYREVGLNGRHSECIQNVGPAQGPEGNYERVTDWLFSRSVAAEPAPPSRAEAIRVRQSFDSLFARLDKELGQDPFRAWQDLRASSPVKGSHLLRVFLQQLIFVASRMSSNALGSANLWVAYPAGDSLHLRSEEREGYFATRQLITVSATNVDFRANRVLEKAQDFDFNSAGAQAYLRDAPVIVDADNAAFPSEPDELTGVTHILGVPLCRKKDVDETRPDQRNGLPLAITIDFCFDKAPDQAECDTLIESGKRLTALFRKFLDQWPKDECRILS